MNSSTNIQKWYEMEITARQDFLPHLTGLLLSQKIQSWAEEEENGQVKLMVYIPHMEGIEENVRRLEELLSVDKTRVVTREIQDQDWAHSWQQFFPVTRIGRGIVIKPPWKDHELPPEPGDIVIEIEPRMAFGSGYHPTTAGTLELVEEYMRPGCRLLDMGCGSGILSIVASRMGAGEILMADYDPICIRESRENYTTARKKYHDMTGQVEYIVSDGFEKIRGSFDIILVNVHTDFILSVIHRIGESLSPGGLFITGSIGTDRVEEMTRRGEDLGMKLLKTSLREGWMGMVFESGLGNPGN